MELSVNGEAVWLESRHEGHDMLLVHWCSHAGLLVLRGL